MAKTRKQELAEFFAEYELPLPTTPTAQEAIHYFILRGNGLCGDTPDEHVTFLKKAMKQWVGTWVRHRKESPSVQRWFVVSVVPKTRAEIAQQIRDRMQGFEVLDADNGINPFKVCVKKSPLHGQTHVMYADMLVSASDPSSV